MYQIFSDSDSCIKKKIVLPLFQYSWYYYIQGIPGGSDGKESACKTGDPAQALSREDPLVKGMATHSSTLAWKIPCTEEPGRLLFFLEDNRNNF